MNLKHPQFITIEGPSDAQNHALGAFLYDTLKALNRGTHLMLEEDGWKEHLARSLSEDRPIIYVKAGLDHPPPPSGFAPPKKA
jgi:hypothetical protein